RSLEYGVNHIYMKKFDNVSTEDLLNQIKTPSDLRLFEIAELLRRNVSIDEIYKLTMID
ncbi:MAG: hypothetical protein K6E24_03940, partial [bacterium]|nr:hypothetical protein [bacterium]